MYVMYVCHVCMSCMYVMYVCHVCMSCMYVCMYVCHNIQFLAPAGNPHRPAGNRTASGRHPFGMQRGPPTMETSYTILGGWFLSKAFASNMQLSCKVFTT